MLSPTSSSTSTGRPIESRANSIVASVLHITNGDSAGGTMRESGLGGDVLVWRDVLHEGPVPAGIGLDELSSMRADYLAAAGAGDAEQIRRDFAERDNTLRRFADYDEVVLWFEWDLYDQLQLIQILDFFAAYSPSDADDTKTRLSIVSHAGYLGTLEAESFPSLMESREEVTREMLSAGREAWSAFRDSDPRALHAVHERGAGSLPFLAAAFKRHLEEFPSMRNGLSRSESQVLEAVAHGPQNFSEIFKSVSHREERVFCGDFTMSAYIERLSECDTPLIAYPSGERIDAPRTEQDSRSFRNAEMALTDHGRQVLGCESDWIAMGGSDRWLGGVHLEGASACWRWDSDSGALRELRMDSR